ncbi:GlmL-related ornithine degradation protein [uncultured Ruegeria sp.]|uniref:GlmL-related ornithine degradation protein n=1 Tax=uncultured Ruegeria sp. TaxID=259304 RepID=UPI00260CEF23|nr:GlmL-related ornithine degradation protein [uncultured Ruegeria sp.]
MMWIDSLVAEIGSTTTTVSAFGGIGTSNPSFLGQGQAPTSVVEGDVRIGLEAAKGDLARCLGVEKVSAGEMLATSSAAGGLGMSVHGLVHDMTARAAKEAALGAGAILRTLTTGRMRRGDIKRLLECRPNIILLAGGVDYGERDTALNNAERIADLDLKVPLIYAGNVQNQDDIRLIFENTRFDLHVTENVYPKIDQLNVEPARRIIQNAFEDHIVHAPGMEHVREMVDGPIMPTPGAVLEAARFLYQEFGDLVVLDVGGATTDVHSVTEGSEEISRISISPEPLAKRTVEGDLGVFVNKDNVVELAGREAIEKKLEVDSVSLEQLMANHPPIPRNASELRFTEELARVCVLNAVERHAGAIRSVYGLSGKKDIAEGKDLTEVKYIVGTGGALTRLPSRVDLLAEVTKHNRHGTWLLPREETRVLIDNHYTLAAVGVLGQRHPEAALALAKQSLAMTGCRSCLPRS